MARASLDRAIQICDAQWNNKKSLWEHYKRHGKELGYDDVKQYKQGGEKLSERPAGGAVTQLESPRGVTIKYEKGSGLASIFSGSNMVSHYKLRKGQIENERNKAKKIIDTGRKDRGKHD